MILQKMTDFVLEKNGNVLNSELAILTVNYAMFLKQPLTLGMLFPCGERYQNVLKEPNRFNFEHDRDYETYLKTYAEAKEKVLFEGFMNVDTRKEGQIYFALKQSHKKNNIDYIMNYAFGLFFVNASNEKSRLNTIEDLLNFHELILTESAIKQIGI